MSEGAIEPYAVYPPNPGPATTGRQNFYRLYNPRYMAPPSPPLGGGGTGGGRPGFAGRFTSNFIYNTMQRAPGGSVPVRVTKPLPQFLGSRSMLLFTWAIAMVLVSLDEWHTYHILPRPARLWYTSLTFLLLAAASTIDAFVPITTLFAFGLIIVLGYQYYQGEGQFGQFGSTEATAKQPAPANVEGS